MKKTCNITHVHSVIVFTLKWINLKEHVECWWSRHWAHLVKLRGKATHEKQKVRTCSCIATDKQRVGCTVSMHSSDLFCHFWCVMAEDDEAFSFSLDSFCSPPPPPHSHSQFSFPHSQLPLLVLSQHTLYKTPCRKI